MSELDTTLAGKSLSDYTNTQLRLALGAVLYTNTAEMWQKYLNQQGYTGSVSDMLQRYYVDRNVPKQFRNYISAGIYLNASIGDPYFGSVVSLLNFTTTGITDVKGKSWSLNGNAVISNGLLLDGAGDWAQTGYSADFDPLTGDFTVEAVVNLVSNASAAFFSHYITTAGYTGGFSLSTNASGLLRAAQAGVAETVAPAGSAVPTGIDVHIALSRTSGVSKTFINGVQQNSVADTTNYLSTSNPPAVIGITRVTNTEPMNGTMKAFRFTKGVGRYTANFAPPALPFPNA